MSMTDGEQEEEAPREKTRRETREQSRPRRLPAPVWGAAFLSLCSVKAPWAVTLSGPSTAFFPSGRQGPRNSPNLLPGSRRCQVHGGKN